MKPDLAAYYGEARLPRYTSYPTAPHFSSAIGPASYADWLKAIPQRASASLYFHVPFCRAMCWYCGCRTTVAKRDEPIAVYEAALRCEIDLVAAQIGRRLSVEHIHFGGGTPTIMAPESFTDLMGAIRHAFFVVPSADIAVEIDPRTLAPAMVRALALGGVNRGASACKVSIPWSSRRSTASKVSRRRRPQSKTCGRPASPASTSTSSTACRTRPLRPASTPCGDVSNCGPIASRCSAMPMCRRSRSISAASTRLRCPTVSIATTSRARLPALDEAGYVQIGLDHFALPGDALAVAFREGRLRRNFQGYTTDTSSALLGFGASAIGQLPQGYVQNEVAIHGYQGSIAAGRLSIAKGYALTDDDRLRADIIERIMCDFGVDLDAICTRHGSAPEAMLKAAPRLEPLIADGVIALDGASLAVKDHARFLVRSVAAAFDAHLDASKRLHSRAV